MRVNVVGLAPLPGELMEVRLALKLRVQNPNEAAIDYNGVALDVELRGLSFASGVSDVQGTIPRYGEAVRIEKSVSVGVDAGLLGFAGQLLSQVRAPRVLEGVSSPALPAPAAPASSSSRKISLCTWPPRR